MEILAWNTCVCVGVYLLCEVLTTFSTQPLHHNWMTAFFYSDNHSTGREVALETAA